MLPAYLAELLVSTEAEPLPEEPPEEEELPGEEEVPAEEKPEEEGLPEEEDPVAGEPEEEEPAEEPFEEEPEDEIIPEPEEEPEEGLEEPADPPKVLRAVPVATMDEDLSIESIYSFAEPGDGYEERLQQIVTQVLESDYPSIDDALPSTTRKIRKMLMILAETPPQTPNFSKLCVELETDYKQGMKMLYALDRARLLNLLEASTASLKNLSRPAKIYCENTNLMHALAPEADIGTIRECFFFNQLCAKHQIAYPAQGDFEVDGKYLYEIGGHKKSFNQIQNIPNSFLAVDNTEIGHGNHVPLWCFGFLY